jgi:hypothetical protein
MNGAKLPRSSRLSLPAPSAVQAALRETTETLAAELGRPGGQAPRWSASEWIVAKAAAALHGVSPLLCRAVPWDGAEGWKDFLEDQRAQTRARHTRIAELLAALDHGTRRQGIVAVPLKGAALHALGLYQAGERPMADVDLLVHPRDGDRTSRLIESLGYYKAGITWKEQIFAPRSAPEAAALGEHAGNGIKIELHDHIGERLPRTIVEIAELILPRSGQPGLNPYPSLAALMLHLLLHAAGSMACKGVRLLNLHDIALLASRMAPADWQQLLAIRAGGLRLWWASPPLFLMMRYYQAPVPRPVLDALRADFPWLLRRSTARLSDVSYSHLWVDAFPGITWSRTPLEALAYALHRIRPTREHLDARKALPATQAWAADREWSALPQSSRIKRWLTSRPPRPATWYVLRAAFGAANG